MLITKELYILIDKHLPNPFGDYDRFRRIHIIMTSGE
jgi:hypothetical protein